MIYLDNAATTAVHPAVLKAMQDNETQYFYNANTTYAGGITAARQIDQARQTILKKLHGTNGQLIFTSGATEANQMIIDALIRRPNQNLVTTSGDHNSVYLPAKNLKERGLTWAEAPLNPDGTIDLTATAALINDQTALFIFSLVNSDVGTWQDAAAVVQMVRARNPRTHIHGDAAQAFCKIDFDVTQLGLDSVTICAHKIHGPKGVGALWVRPGITVPARHGTLNNAGIIGFAQAVATFNAPLVTTLHQYLITHLPAGCTVNGLNNNPFITNISLPHVFGETVLNALSTQNIYVGLGSACARHRQGNRTLAAMKFTPTQQKQVLRISCGMYNTLAEIQTFLQALTTVLQTIGSHHIA